MRIKKFIPFLLLIFTLYFILLIFNPIIAYADKIAYADHYRFAMPQRLKDHYCQLREKYYYDYAIKKRHGDLRYYVAAVLHDAGELKWDECDNYEKKYGEKCNCLSRKLLCSILYYISSNYAGSSRAEQIYNYVKAIVPYKEETGDYPRFPLETLYYHGGDCEDSAMTVAALLKLAGYTTGLYTIHDSAHNINHCVCVCKVPDCIDGEKWRIKEYYSQGHCWLMIDPAYKHRFGYNPSWVKNYLQSSNYLTIPDEVANCLLIDYDTYKDFCEKMDREKS